MKRFSSSLPSYSAIVLGILSATFTAINLDIIYGVVVAILWALGVLGIAKLHLVAKYALVFMSVVLGISVALNVVVPLLKDNGVTETVGNVANKYVEDTTVYPDSTIYVEAETGTLKNASSYSFIGETSRGIEAYLGDGNASVTYSFNVKTKGDYVLFVRTNDDNLHDNDTRSVSITIDDTVDLKYSHVSEDTNGWKWFEIGDVSLESGLHTIVFTKIKTTTAAYSMDAFRFDQI